MPALNASSRADQAGNDGVVIGDLIRRGCDGVHDRNDAQQKELRKPKNAR
ncbi:hypothetical protein ACX1DW_17180 [Stutzerimonas sp. KH-1]|jgi:hypothetical protein